MGVTSSHSNSHSFFWFQPCLFNIALQLLDEGGTMNL